MSELKFKSNTPCKNCPYRKDAPLRLWHNHHYLDLLKYEKEYFGVVYACHKKNGCVCIGWLMMQDKNRLPSISLRMKLMKENIGESYLDSLHSKSEMYETTADMVLANYPELKPLIR